MGGASDENDPESNCFRVTTTGSYGIGAHNSSGADYAEMFEWADGNPGGEDRFVTLEGDKIRLAGKADDFILGVVSGDPSVVGDVYDDQWHGMFERDIFGRFIMEDEEIPAERDDEGNIVREAYIERRKKINPGYDGAQAYTPRSERPEWSAVGMMGKLVMVDDGTCRINGWCAPGEGGAATASGERTKFRVMASLDETHIRVMALPQ